MAQSIKNISIGSKVRDSKGNEFTVIAKNHFGSNQVTLMHTNAYINMPMHTSHNKNSEYGLSEVHYYLSNDYLKTLQEELKNNLIVTDVPYMDAISTSQYTKKTVQAKVFIPAISEVVEGRSDIGAGTKFINYFSYNDYATHTRTWTRSEVYTMTGGLYSSHYDVVGQGTVMAPGHVYCDVIPFMNIPNTLLVSDSVSNGCYSLMFNEPPVIQTISGIQGNYGSVTDISYVAIDNDDAELTHYISFDNGTTFKQISPSRNGNIYTYSHVFNELNTYYCRVKVVDGAKNEVVSNAFTITINAVAPTVNIVSVVDKVVTFRTNCITSEISKVEILINDKVVKTFTNGFDFNLVYEIDRNNLNIGKNSIQIKATSQENLVGYANLEASKTKYNLPPVGTKVIIGGIEYTISNASENGSNQTYTLNNNLINQVKKGDTVQVTQDSVKVLCSMSNLENSKNYKEMKLVKTKKLKDDFEGYVEEKYELQGDGRYSTIKLEMQRFNNNVATEILELQQYFDYIED